MKWESNNWSPARATWYGTPTGAGSEGGACGYGDAVSQTPFSSVVSAEANIFTNPEKDVESVIRVKCNYPGMAVAFHVDSGSNPYYFATVVEFDDGEGDLATVELQQNRQDNWLTMQRLWGANWKLNSGSPLAAPFSLRLTSGESY
ncbi:hypothetical protein EZV62_009603 [Acer yangbiense]|uniref:Expansin-like CBD domain-containing protein n=1 Tax=Acer yangbiense TaxID=1000413 RepID=A0A5C7I0R8_9ROSI|nr:hypothetical protein EZV62_009603 [Acer yangbiense]